MFIKNQKIPIKEIALTGFFPSFLKKIIYRFKGYKIGKNVTIGIGSIIIGKRVEIHDNVKIGHFTLIMAGNIKINRHVGIASFVYIDTESLEIGEDTRIREQVFVGGLKLPESLLKIGERCIIMQLSYLNPTKPIIIDDDSGIGGHCLLFTHASWSSALDGYPVKFEPISIGKNVWLAWRVFILPGMSIGDNCTIGANSLINISIPDNSLASGNPIKIALSGEKKWPRKLNDGDKIKTLKKIIEEYISYIQYYSKNITIHRSKNVEEISFNDTHSKLYIFWEKTERYPVLKKNIIFLLDDDELITGQGMIINLKQRTRSGTLTDGEEFLKFLSRYGIRFKRKD
jgi:acetyltransferase-like isoleucine patch superfamily enzyme